MTKHTSDVYTKRLRQLMQQRQISSFKGLREQALISKGVVRHLRTGQVGEIRLEALDRLSQVLVIPLPELIRQFDQTEQLWPQIEPTAAPDCPELMAVRRDYEYLQAQLTQQAEQLQDQFQQQSLATIESWLLQWPTAVAAVQANQTLPAIRLLPLVKPLEDLLVTWTVEPIGAVGTDIPYDPHSHQLLDGIVQPGDLVRVRYVGYRHGDRILHRAKVSPI